MSYTYFLLVVLELTALFYCVRYLYWYYIAHNNHKRALAKMAEVADAETMQKHSWKPAEYLQELDEADLADKIRAGLNQNQE